MKGRLSPEARDRAWAGGVFLALGALYWTLRSRSFGPGDSPQHVLSSLVWGVSWPPGYPLYNTLGHLASLLAPGGPAAAVNGLSGLLHALTSAVLFLTLRRQGASLRASLAGTALMSFSPLYWFYSEAAEVRALNDALAVCALFCAVEWARTRRWTSWAGLAAAVGLGASHHPTFVLVLPALALYLWLKRAVPGPRLLAFGAAGAALSCALPYLVLGLRLKASPPLYNPTGVHDWGGLWALFSRRELGGMMRMVGGSRELLGPGGFDWGGVGLQCSWLLRGLSSELLLPGLVLAGLGARSLYKRNRADLALWTAWAAVPALTVVFFASQQLRLPDADYARAIALRFYLLPFIGLFALAGHGLDSLMPLVRPAVGRTLALVCFAPLLLRPISLRGHDPLLRYGEDLLKSSGPSDIVVLAADDTILATTYLDLIAKRAEDRVFLNPVMLSYPPYLRALRVRHPDLQIPEPAPNGGPPSWRRWLELNAGRGLCAEAVLKDILLREFPDAAPRGVLLEARLSPAPRAELSRRASAFLDESQVSSLSLSDLNEFTQEIYVARAYAAALDWYAQVLGPEDGAVLARIERSRLRL